MHPGPSSNSTFGSSAGRNRGDLDGLHSKRSINNDNLEDRALRAEERVCELEESLAQFIDDFELLNEDLSVCA